MPWSRVTSRNLCAAHLLAAPFVAFAAQPFPPPGLYRVDTVNTQDASARGVTATQQITMQGGTGNTAAIQQVTGQAAVSAGAAAGRAPVTSCIKPGSDPAKAMSMQAAGGCRMTPAQPKVEGDTASFSLQCPTLDQDLQSQRVDAKTWEWRIVTRVRSAGIGAMPPATAAAMAPAIAQMEARLRQKPDGAEADGIRQSLSAIRGGAQANQSVVVQRYTKIAESCS